MIRVIAALWRPCVPWGAYGTPEHGHAEASSRYDYPRRCGGGRPEAAEAAVRGDDAVARHLPAGGVTRANPAIKPEKRDENEVNLRCEWISAHGLPNCPGAAKDKRSACAMCENQNER